MGKMQNFIEENTNHIHKQTITKLQLTELNHERCILSSSRDKKVLLSELKNNLVLKKEFAQHNHFVSSFCSTQDMKKVISACWDKKIRIFDVETKDCFAFTGHDGPVKTISISSDENKIATGGFDKKVVIWSFDGEKIDEIEGNSWVSNVLFVPEQSDVIIISYYDGSIVEYSISDKNTEVLVQPSDSSITCLEISPDGSFLFSADKSGKVLFLNLKEKGSVFRTIELNSEVTAIAIASTNTFIAIATPHEIKILDILVEDKEISTINISEKKSIYSTALTWGPKNLYVGTNVGDIITYSLDKN